MLRFVQRSSRSLHKTPVVLETVAARSFGNIRANTIGRSHYLPADRVPGKHVPAKNDFPDFVCQLFSQLVNPKIFKIRSTHNLGFYCARRFQATDYRPLTTYQLLKLNRLVQFAALGTARAVHIRVVGVNITAVGTAENPVLGVRWPEAAPAHLGI